MYMLYKKNSLYLLSIITTVNRYDYYNCVNKA